MELLSLVPNTPAFDGAVDCYRRIWDRDGTVAFRKHAEFPGYRGFVAVEDGAVVGYVYGYTSEPGQYYHEALRAVLPPSTYARWLDDCFELVELGVAPEARGRGLGGRLHDCLLQGLPHATSVLTTGVDNEAARELYERRDWEAVFEPFDPEGGEPMVVYGRALDATDDALDGPAVDPGGAEKRRVTRTER
ncbi:GNAT family N-acetyltransferase [Halomarina rubra]|uniref:GNAT family N-acetyltransferase n=1 Tax=Halomarina rubra TaxID=2071873 RepID=A0ABD6AYH2_9EURY|nr:GNAT family N-acetyltransferase [Halomarina rubra]